MTTRRSVEVIADWAGLGGARLMGGLHADKAKAKEVLSFEYDKTWLRDHVQVLDPRLTLYAGPQFPPESHQTFGVFKDSAPDKFGRALMRRREAQTARAEGRAERILTDFDYLLGVHDTQRLGALRFRFSAGRPFLDDNEEGAAPPLTRLRELEAASLELEREGIEEDAAYARLLALLAPGSSLGGARPKAGVVDTDGSLWIAKFPSRTDDHDVGAWEAVTHDLARRAHVDVAPARSMQLGIRTTFLTRRFDRGTTGERLHFGSSMTLLDRLDGDDASTGASYLELAEFLTRFGTNVSPDLEQLWRRIVFFMCVSNVDDHLRNHGFLLDPAAGGWRLAPAYDMNPVATADGLKLNVSDSDNSQDLDLARSVISFFRISSNRADAIIDEVRGAVRTWREVAGTVGVPRADQGRMARAFRLAS